MYIFFDLTFNIQHKNQLVKKNYHTYKKSGVNIASADNLVKFISKITKKSSISGTKLKSFKNIGSFGSIFDLSKAKIKQPIIVSSTDGVGTKIELAQSLNNFKYIGIDLVAMCVNDLIVQGAKPLFFLDYIATGKIDQKRIKIILKSIVKGCKLSNCSLVGGEIAEMPGTYNKNKIDLAGFSVGAVEKKKLLVQSKIKLGNILLAVPSSGVHSNGFSLIRNILKNKKIKLGKNKNLKNELLKPTKIYTNEIIKLHKKNLINGCAHITGGGLISNLERVLPKNLSLKINLNKIKVLKIFKWLKLQSLSENEMLKVFNCGVGFCLIVKKNNIKKVQKFFSKKYKPYPIGIVVNKQKNIKSYGKIQW